MVSLSTVAGSSATMLGQVAISTGNSLVLSSGTQTIGTVLNATTTNQIGSVALVAGSSANTVGSVALLAGSSDNELGGVNLTSGSTAFLAGAFVIGNGSTGNTAGSVALLAGSSANTIGSVALIAGTTANSIGSVALVAGSSANTIGAVAVSSANSIYLGIGTSATYQFAQSIPFSTATIARTSVSTTVDISVIAANANRKALVIANGSTTQTVSLGFSTAAVTTGLANATVYLAAAPGAGSVISFGIHGGLPLYTGPIRGINLTSTTVAGGIFVTEWT